MPVIKGKSGRQTLDADRRRTLLESLRSELAGTGKSGGPLIFEIPLEPLDKIDVMVVWKDWRGIRSEDRSDLIFEAYGKPRRQEIAQALGVTYDEAMGQNLLPYSVSPLTREGDEDPDKIRQAMLDLGAMTLPGDLVQLRFPTLPMAEDAHRQLCKQLPRGYWTIIQDVYFADSRGDSD